MGAGRVEEDLLELGLLTGKQLVKRHRMAPGRAYLCSVAGDIMKPPPRAPPPPPPGRPLARTMRGDAWIVPLAPQPFFAPL